MGTWGSKIYEDDVALDIRHDFLEHLENSVDVSKIEEIIFDETIDHKSDQDDIDVVILALCCVELETATLTDDTKAKAIEILESERNHEYWKRESDAKSAALRKRELDLIKKYILSYDKDPVKRKSWIELQKIDNISENIKPEQKFKLSSVIVITFYTLAVITILIYIFA